MKFGPRCGCCCVEECNMPFVILRFCLAGFLLVLCRLFAFLASSLQVLCKCLAKFLAKSVQEFSAGGETRGKVGSTLVPKSIPNGANLAQGVGKGYPKINKTIICFKENANANTQMRRNIPSFFFQRFPQKTESSTAGRLPFKNKKVIKLLYKTYHKETQPKQQMSQSPSKK